MGTIIHHAIIVTGHSYPSTEVKFKAAHQKAKELFGASVSEIVPSHNPNYVSFFVAPDGSNEGWMVSNECDAKREEFEGFINSLAYDDGSNSVSFVGVAYDTESNAEISQTNKKIMAEYD